MFTISKQKIYNSFIIPSNGAPRPPPRRANRKTANGFIPSAVVTNCFEVAPPGWRPMP